MDYLFEGAGIAGVVLIVGSYLLLQVGRLNPRGLAYSAVNILGSLLIIVSLVHSWNLAAFIIEIFWFLISAYGLLKNMRNPLPYENL